MIPLINNKNKPKTKLHFQRFEFKYQMGLDIVEGIIPELLKYMDFDPYALKLHNHAYAVTSLYYDSVGLGCYYDKISGLRQRKKIRIRTYDHTVTPETTVFLEIKRKYDNVVVKDRIKTSFIQSQMFLDGSSIAGLAREQTETLEEFLWFKAMNAMVPQNLVVYSRKPLLSKTDAGFRVTIDYQLRTRLAASLDEKGVWQEVNPGMAVLEVKFNNIMPFWFHHIIQRYGLQQQPFSKYCQALEVCRPEVTEKTLVEVYNPSLMYGFSI